MADFLVTTLSYPTVIFTVLLGVAIVYWTLVIVGAMGIDVLDLDFEADGAAEGASEGAAEGAADGALHGLLHALRLREAPMTLVLSLVFVWAWFLSHVGSLLFAPMVSFLPSSVTGTLVGVVALVAALPMTSLCLAPFRKLFEPQRQITRQDLVGKIVRVSTGRVDGAFGTATADDGGAGLIVQVRCDADNDLGRGDKALVLEWDAEREAYEVTPMSDLLPPKLPEA
jgi:hypothetical protein